MTDLARRHGSTPDGQLHPATGVRLLLEDYAASEKVNPWAKSREVAAAAEREVLEAAASHLLALHALQLKDDEPSVAVRNVRVGDYVRLHGIKCYVYAIRDVAKARTQDRAIHLKVNYHRKGGPESSFAYAAYVRIPLIARPLENS
jgi:hypothetical protein